jgi:hypothetical protein
MDTIPLVLLSFRLRASGPRPLLNNLFHHTSTAAAAAAGWVRVSNIKKGNQNQTPAAGVVSNDLLKSSASRGGEQNAGLGRESLMMHSHIGIVSS